MSLNSTLETLIKISDKRDAERSAFLKHVLLMASSLFGFLVALHKTPSTLYSIRIVFSLALILLSLGILLLTIALFQQLAVYKQQFLLQKEEVLLHIRDENYKPKILLGEPSRIYRYCEMFGYISLCFAVISLTVYAILIA